MPNSSDESTADTDNVVYRPYMPEEFKEEVLKLSPMVLLDKLYNSHNVIYYRLLEGFGQHLSSTCQLDSTKKKELFDQILPQYETAVEVMLDKNFSLFQQYFLDSILQIPQNQDIVPIHYKGLDMEITDEHLEKLDEELERAKNDVIGQRAFQHWAIKEEERHQRRLQTKKEYLEQFGIITAMMKEHNVTDLDAILQKIKVQSEELDRRMKRRLDTVFGLWDSPESYTLGCTEYIHKYLVSHSNSHPS